MKHFSFPQIPSLVAIAVTAAVALPTLAFSASSAPTKNRELYNGPTVKVVAQMPAQNGPPCPPLAQPGAPKATPAPKTTADGTPAPICPTHSQTPKTSPKTEPTAVPTTTPTAVPTTTPTTSGNYS